MEHKQVYFSSDEDGSNNISRRKTVRIENAEPKSSRPNNDHPRRRVPQPPMRTRSSLASGIYKGGDEISKAEIKRGNQSVFASKIDEEEEEQLSSTSRSNIDAKHIPNVSNGRHHRQQPKHQSSFTPSPIGNRNVRISSTTEVIGDKDQSDNDENNSDDLTDSSNMYFTNSKRSIASGSKLSPLTPHLSLSTETDVNAMSPHQHHLESEKSPPLRLRKPTGFVKGRSPSEATVNVNKRNAGLEHSQSRPNDKGLEGVKSCSSRFSTSALERGKSSIMHLSISDSESEDEVERDDDEESQNSRLIGSRHRSKELSSPGKKLQASATYVRLIVGTLVEGNYRGRNKFYPGKITRCRFNGTYDILYDDGERELGISRDVIRLKEESGVITDITAANTDRDKNESGSDSSINTSGLKGEIGPELAGLTCNYGESEGDKLEPLPYERAYQLEAGCPTSRTTVQDVEIKEVVLELGEAIESRYRGKSKYYPGQITRKRFDGTFDILYDDGERELGVSRDLIRCAQVKQIDDQHMDEGIPRNQTNSESLRSGDQSAIEMTDQPLSGGEYVEVRYRGKSKYYPGKITRKRFDGTFDILYDDGERELNVSIELIRRRLQLSPNPESMDQVEFEHDGGDTQSAIQSTELSISDIPFDVGDKINARYRGKSSYYPAEITRKHFDGTYDVFYDDGKCEIGVSKELIERRTPKRIQGQPKGSQLETVSMTDSSPSAKSLSTGDIVEARYRGMSQFYPGKIIRKRYDGTCDVLYDDGERELGVSSNLIRITRSQSTGKVERARVLDTTKSSANNDTSYAEKTRGLSVRSNNSPSRRNKDTNNGDDSIGVGTSIEARYRGRDKFYRGTISKVYYNEGLYDIKYDDGDEEKRVAKVLIKEIRSSLPQEERKVSKPLTENRENFNREETGFQLHDKVECRYKGSSHSPFYPGTISKVLGDNKYDIRYDDGDRDNSLAIEHIRLLSGSEGSSTNNNKESAYDEGSMSSSEMKIPPTFQLGMLVEAKYQGRGEIYYQGTICGISDKGSYNIQYEDGDFDNNLLEEHIRLVNDGNISNENKGLESATVANEDGQPRDQIMEKSELEIGTKVEADYMGRGKYYPAKVASVVGSNCYDVCYDDGDRELRVPLARITTRAVTEGDKKQVMQLDKESLRSSLISLFTNDDIMDMIHTSYLSQVSQG